MSGSPTDSEADSRTVPEVPVFDVRYFREPRGFLNLGVHIDARDKNIQFFAGRWHLSVGWHDDEVPPHPGWTSLIAYRDKNE